MAEEELHLIRRLYSRQGFIDEVYDRLPAAGRLVEAYWSVEGDHQTYFGCTRYSGFESFKTVLSKARRKKIARLNSQ